MERERPEFSSAIHEQDIYFPEFARKLRDALEPVFPPAFAEGRADGFSRSVVEHLTDYGTERRVLVTMERMEGVDGSTAEFLRAAETFVQEIDEVPGFFANDHPASTIWEQHEVRSWAIDLGDGAMSRGHELNKVTSTGTVVSAVDLTKPLAANESQGENTDDRVLQDLQVLSGILEVVAADRRYEYGDRIAGLLREVGFMLPTNAVLGIARN